MINDQVIEAFALTKGMKFQMGNVQKDSCIAIAAIPGQISA